MSRRLLLIRHPPVPMPFRSLCYGWADIPSVPLCQARLHNLAEQMTELGRDILLYHSDLSRCASLAEALAVRLGIIPQHDSRLRERHFGEWEKRSWAEIHAETGDAMMGMVTAPDRWRPPGGETTFQLRDRVMAWYSELPNHGLIVAVTHGGPIAALRGTLQCLPVSRWPALIPKCGEMVRVDATASCTRSRYSPTDDTGHE